MTHDDGGNPLWERIRETYNVPGETPSGEMWASISAELARPDAERVDESAPASAGDVIDLTSRRAARGGDGALRGRIPGWGVAAAAVLVLGIGIGRMTAPSAAVGPISASTRGVDGGGGLALAAREHLGRTESLLTMVRADARDGSIDPEMAGWAKDLLGQTRLLIDAGSESDATTRDLLLDLELILIQIAAVTETGSSDEARSRTELELTLRSLEEGEFLPRLQAALPSGMAGT